MSFPAYGFTPKVDSVDTIYAADVNDLQDAVQEIADIVDGMTGGGGATFPMAEGVWYSPFTAIGGQLASHSTNNIVTADDTAFAVLIQIYEACTISKVGVISSIPAGETTLLFSLHEPSTSGGVGVKVGDLGEIVTDELYGGEIPLEDTCSVAVTPGWYWSVVSSDAPISLVNIHAGTVYPCFAGPTPQDAYGDSGVNMGIVITSTGIEDAIPSDLTSATQVPYVAAPNILFQIDHP